MMNTHDHELFLKVGLVFGSIVLVLLFEIARQLRKLNSRREQV